MSTDVSTAHDLEMVSEILTRVTNDLFTVVDREIEVVELETERVTERAAGLGKIHISFKLAVTFAEPSSKRNVIGAAAAGVASASVRRVAQRWADTDRTKHPLPKVCG